VEFYIILPYVFRLGAYTQDKLIYLFIYVYNRENSCSL